MSSALRPETRGRHPVSDILRARAEATPAREALVFLRDGETDAASVSYGDLDRKARAHAALLADAGAKPDEDGAARVLLLHTPSVDYVAAFFGILYAGLVPVPAYVPRNARGMPRLLGIVEDSRASLVATTEGAAATLDRAGGGFAKLRRVLPPPPAEEASLARGWQERDAAPEACALLQYTSGSTSRPKGVALQNAQLTANTAAIAAAFGTGPDSVGVIWLPPYHDMGLIGGILHPIAAGFPVVLMPPMAFLQRPVRWLEAIARYRATISGGPNFAYDLATRKITPAQRERLDLSSWTTAFCGAEPIRAATLTRFSEVFRASRFSASAFVPCYGLAEATLLVTGARRDRAPRVHDAATRVVGCGPAAGETRVVIVDPASGTAQPEGEEGEIWVTGPGVAQGYFRAPDATRATFGAQLPGEDVPYLRTGDLGCLRDGELFVTGRIKEVIIVRGRKLHPRDIEEAAQSAVSSLRAHGGAAFSSRDRVVLVQELERGTRPPYAHIAEAIRVAVADALEVALDAVLLVRAGTVPVTSSGKLQRAACRATYEDGSIEVLYESSADLPDEGLSAPTIAVARAVAAEVPTPATQVASILRVDAAHLAPGVALTALGLDSLAAVEVASLVRAAGAETSVDELLSGLTWGALEQRLAQATTGPRPPRSSPALGASAPGMEEEASHVERAAVAHSRARPESSALNVAVAGWVEGALDVPALDRAVRALEARHDALRTTFDASSHGASVLRRVASASRAQVERVACEEDELPATLAETAWTPFDMDGAPLFRVVVAQVKARSALLLAAHHAIVDLASLEVLLRDLGALYARELGDPAPLFPAPVQASDAVRLERAFVEHEAEAFARRWEERLPHPLPVLDLPRASVRRRAPLRPAGLVHFEVPEATRAEMKGLAAATRSSTFTILLATYHLVLHHWSGQDDIVVGCEAAGRTRAELMDVVGSFARPLPIHASVDRRETFSEMVSALRGAVVGALEDQSYPLLAILDRLIKRGAAFEADVPPVFQGVFNFTRDREGDLAAVALGRGGATLALGPLRLHTIALPPAHAHSEIALLAAAGAAGETLELTLLHDAELFEPAQMKQLAGDIAALLTLATAAPETTIEGLLARLPARRVPVRVAANFTAMPITPALKHWLELAGLPPSVAHLPYDGLLTALHDGALRGPGANVLLVRPESLSREAPGPGRDAALASNLDVLLAALEAFGGAPPPPTVLAVTPADEETEGVVAARERLLAWARAQPWLSTLDLSEVAARFEVAAPFDRETLALGDAPLSEAMAAATGAAAARSLRSMMVAAKKVVVVDADGTLWGGVAAEDGPQGVRVDGPYRELQKRLVALHEAGVLIAVVSKNVDEDVAAVFEHRREMLLSREHLVAVRASWSPKPDVVRALAAELSLGLDAFVFIDDSPVECAAMRAACPEVLVVELPDRAEAIPRRLDAVWELDRPRTTDEDRRRVEMYRDQAGRQAARAQAGSLEAFLAALELAVDFAPLGAGDLPRAAQLTQRTNQLNTTALRMTEAELAERAEAWVVRVRDRFGDYGLVGLVVLEPAGHALSVPVLLLSCRALGRGVEARLLAWLGERARAHGAPRIVLAYTTTARNEPARRMLEAASGQPLSGDTGDVTIEAEDVARAAARLMPSEAGATRAEGAGTARTTPTARPRAGGARLLDASTACDRAEALLAALGGARRRRLGPTRPLEGTEASVAAVWCEVLGVDACDPDDDFFALGGTSLQALAMVARLRRTLGAELDLATVFERPRLADLARVVGADALAPGRAQSTAPAAEPAPVPATAMQRRLWVLSRLDEADPAYHVPFAARLAGPVDPAAWREAFATLVRRHEALRLRFTPLDDEPYVTLGDGSDVLLELTSCAPEALDGWMAERIGRPFALEAGPLVRASLARLEGSDEHVLLVVLHHAVADGASLVTLVRELSTLLRGQALPGEAPSWIAYARAEAAADPAAERRALEAARVALAGLEPLPLPLAPPASPGLRRGAVAVRVLPAARAAAVRALARDRATTPFTVLVAAYAVVLGRLAGRDDVALGIPVSSRDETRWEALVGPLVNTVVMRMGLEGDADARALVTRAHDATQAAYARAAVPFERLVAALVPDRDPTRAPLVQAMIVEQPAASSIAPAGGPLHITPLRVTSGGAQLDLTLAVSHEPGAVLRLALEYRADRISAEAAEAFLQRLEGVIAGMTDEPARSLATFELLTEEERRRILGAWAGPRRPYVTDEGLARAFERQVDLTPDAVAVTSPEGTRSYAELDRAANRLAHALVARGVQRGDRVGIALPRSEALVAAVHACLKLGAPYVPLEPDLPAARAAFMAEDAGVVAVLCDAGEGARFGERGLVADDVMNDSSRNAGRPDVLVRGDDLAYVLYTSGSTGAPKGVMVEHGGVQNRLCYQEETLALGPGDAVLHKTPYGFDVSVWELLWPLRVGSRLVLAAPGAHKDPDELVALMMRERVSDVHFVPSMLEAFVETEGVERLTCLKRVFASGEALPRDAVARLRARLPDVAVHNFYGPTEASIEVTHHEVPQGPVGAIPIGRPIANTRLYVVDGRGALLPPGAVGELWISGIQVARGYLGDTARTREAFAADPFVPGARVYRTGDLGRFLGDGTIDFLGRKDRQVKIRGNRIELSEIEVALRAHPRVDAAVVTARGGRLVAYVVSRDAGEDDLRAHLAARLPEAMIPAVFVALPELPLGPTGKVALQLLPEPAHATKATGDAPSTEGEQALAEIWTSVLGVHGFGRDADFFALGGDSILALKIVSRGRARGLSLVPRDLFERPTLRGLAARAERRGSSTASAARVEAGERAPLLPMQAAFFARHAPPVRDRFCQSVRLTAGAAIDVECLTLAIDAVAAAHPALATLFEQEGGRVLAQRRPPAQPRGVAWVAHARPGEDGHARAAASIRIEGPLVAACVDGAEATLVVHHAVVDAISWRVMLADLAAAYEALVRGEVPALAAADGTFAWAGALDSWSRGDGARTEAETWKQRFEPLPPEAYRSELAREAGRAADAETLSVALGRETTARLFAVLRATFAEVDEAIAGALAVALTALAAPSHAEEAPEPDAERAYRVLDIERHGRDAALGASLDLPRAVGWLTALFPVAIRPPRASDPRAVLAAAREAFAMVPNGGVGFGALAVALPPRDVVVNYVGAFAGGDEGSGLRFALAGGHEDRHPDGPREHVLEVVGGLSDGALTLRFGYPRTAASTRAVTRLAARTMDELARLAVELDALPAHDTREDVHPPAPVQQGIAIESARAPSERGTYVEQLTLDIDATLDEARLRTAWEGVVARHPALRSELVAGFVVVAPAREVLERGIFATAAIAAGEEALEGWLAADRARGFDLARAPLLRITLLTRGAARTMVLTHHHAIADGWCIPLLLREALASLRGDDLGPAPPPYREYVRWLGQQDRAAARAHFRARLGSLARGTAPPRDRAVLAGAPRTSPRRTLRHVLSAQAVAAMTTLAREAGVTTSTVALAAFALTLARMTGEPRVVFAVTVHGRPADLVGSESMVGVLIQTLPFVVETAGDQDVRRWLAAVQEDLLRDQGHAHVGLADLQGAHPAAVVENLFVVENYPLPAAEELGGLAFGPPRVHRQVKAPFAFVVPPGPPAAEVDLDPLRVSEEDGRDFLERYASVIGALAGAPAARVRHIDVLSAEERDRALALASPPRATRSDLDARTLHGRFLEAAAEAGTALAVVDDRQSMTYDGLRSAAEALAVRLTGAGVRPGDRVGVVAGPGAEHVTAVLGALLAGGAFMPFDPSYPEARLEAMRGAARPSAVVATATTAALARRIAGDAPVVVVDLEASAAEPWSAPARHAHDLAYVLFTSGSTGRPKGVMCHHAGVEALVDDLDARAKLPAGERASQWTSPSFDVSVWEIFAALTRGAALHVVPQAVRADARALIAWMDEHLIASAYLPGFALEALAERLEAGGCRALRRLLIGVEPIASALASRLLAHAPELVVVNGYGPTEASVCATLHTVVPDDARSALVPIGRAVKGARVYLLDGRMEPVLERVPGEIFVGGAGVAHGYLDAAEAAAERFVADPFAPPHARMYRTGDRAIALEDGTLLFLGRRDRQVKVRGVRVELGEIEAALARLPFVRESAVVALETPAGASLVAAVALHDRQGDLGRVRAELRHVLPDAMVPARVLAFDTLPRDPNGKLDRRALRAAMQVAKESGEGGLSPTAEILAGLAGELFGGRPRQEDDFLSAGGDSLSATRLTARIANALGVALPLSAVFEAKSFAALAARIDAARAQAPGRTEVPLLASGDEVGPTSFAQERLLFIDRLDPGNPVYNLACAARLRGPLDLTVLRRALDTCVRRHGALRTAFVEEGGSSVQRLGGVTEVLRAEDVTDLRGAPDPLARALALAGDDVRRPFDLARGPLLRAHVYVLGEEDFAIALGLHHVAADGWSLGIVLREVLALYAAFARGAPSPLPELPIQYLDFARWQRGQLEDEGVTEKVRAWAARLTGAPPLLELPTDVPRPEVQSFRGGHVRFALEPAVVQGVEALARRSGATCAMVLLTALDALLVRWSGATDVSVGVSLANRRRREVEALVGFFVNVVVVRAELPEASMPFSALVRHVRERSLEAYDLQDVPFDRVVDELRPKRTLAHAPLFQVNFVHDDAPRLDASSGTGLEVTALDVDTGTSRFDLALSLLRDGAQIHGALEYNGDIFARRTAEALVTGFQHLLAAALEDPQTPIDALPLGGPRAPAPSTSTSGPRASRPPRFVQAFEAAVDAAPEAPALISRAPGEKGVIDYAELDRRSSQVAQALRAAGVGRDVVVGVCAPRSASAVVAILAILRAGGAFLPLDPDVPLARLAAIVESASPALVVTTEAAVDRVPSTVANVLVLEELPVAPAGRVARPAPAENASEDDLAYVIYTSGSTGTPNGVAVTHRGLSNLALAQSRAFGIAPASRVLQFASLGFDASISEIATALACGAALDLGGGPDRGDVVDSLRHVTVATLPPSLLAVLAPAAYPDLATVVSAGEALPADVARRWLQAGKRLVNAYGPTEAAVCATLGDVQLEDLEGTRAPSIGSAMDGVRVYVLDARRALVPPGVVGELAIGGAGVARGYVGRSELTEARFVPDPFVPGERIFLTGDRARLRHDGRLEFAGRNDQQLKVRGHRVEAGDVEAALRRHAGVSDAAVVIAAETRRLVAYVVPVDGSAAPREGELAGFVAARLPAFMVPDRVVIASALPLTSSGKVDRRALAARPDAAATPREHVRVAPRNDLEAILARAMAEVLRVPEVGVHDNFFELGGDSIASIQVAARARREGIAFAVKDLFLRQTVAELAQTATVVAKPEIFDVPAEGEVPLTPIQRWFFEQRSPDAAYYNQSVLLEVDAPLALDTLREAARVVTLHHDALRLRFEEASPAAVSPADPWQQRYAEAEGSVILERAPASELEAATHRAQRGLDLARGPVARIVLFEGTPARLLLVAHHLVMDAVSLRIVLTDLLTAYAALAEGREARLPPRTASYKAWAGALRDASLDLSAERRVLEALARGFTRLPTDGPGGEARGTRGAARTLTTTLDATETAALERSLLSLGVTVEQGLLTALGTTLAPALRGGALVVDVEGHGRDALAPGRPIDVTRTVGWFTSVSPVRLEATATSDVRAMLRSMKESIAALPRSGAGFGVLGYVGSGELSFNYLGRVDGPLVEGVRLCTEQGAEDQSPRTPRPAAIELQAMIVEGRLRVLWTHLEARHHPATVEAWASGLLEGLRALTASAETMSAPVYTTDDFPEAGMTREELADVLGELEEPES